MGDSKARSFGLGVTAIAAAMTVSILAGARAQVTYTTGKAAMSAGEYFDFDAGAVSERAKADVRYSTGINAKGRLLEPLNRAGLGILQSNRKLYETCAAHVDELPAKRIDLSKISKPVYVCIRTSERRVGVLLLDPANLADQRVSLGFTLWEQPRTKPAAPQDNKIIPKIVDAPSTAEDAADPLFAQPIDPVYKPAGEDDDDPSPQSVDRGDKPGAQGPKGGDNDEDADPPAPIDQVDKPGAAGAKGADDDGELAGPVGTDDKPGAPEPKGTDDDSDAPQAPIDPGDKPGAHGPKGVTSGASSPDLGNVQTSLHTNDHSCPSTLSIMDGNVHRSGRTESGWDFELGRRVGGEYAEVSILHFLEARLEDSNRRLTCSYIYRTRAEFHRNNVHVNLAAEAAQYVLTMRSESACTPLSGFDSAGLCLGSEDEDWNGCPSVGGSFDNGRCDLYYQEPELCKVQCSAPTALE
jgi:hypothetical protein